MDLLFFSEITPKVSKLIEIKWRLHTAWRPQASGKVEKMNHTLKKNIPNLCQETHLHWDQVLPIALLRIRAAPRSGIQLSPYEIVYGQILDQLMTSLVLEVSPPQVCYNLLSLEIECYSRLRRQNPQKPTRTLTGPWDILLATPIVVKLAGIKPWTHHTRVKKPSEEQQTAKLQEDLKVIFWKQWIMFFSLLYVWPHIMKNLFLSNKMNIFGYT